MPMEPLRSDEALSDCINYLRVVARTRHSRSRSNTFGPLRAESQFRSSRNSDAGSTPVTRSRFTSPRARHVEQVALRVVDIFEIGFVHNALDPGLKREDFVVAAGDDYGPELEALGEMHGSDRDGASCASRAFAQSHCGESRILDALDGPVQFSLGSDEHTNLLWLISLLSPFLQPVRDASRLLLRRCETPQKRLRAVEGRDGAAALLGHAVHIGNLVRQEPICLPSNLMRCAVVDPQGLGTSSHVDAQGTPGERCLEDPLAQVTPRRTSCWADCRR